MFSFVIGKSLLFGLLPSSIQPNITQNVLYREWKVSLYVFLICFYYMCVLWCEFYVYLCVISFNKPEEWYKYMYVHIKSTHKYRIWNWSVCLYLIGLLKISKSVLFNIIRWWWHRFFREIYRFFIIYIRFMKQHYFCLLDS